jgi:hypothetical protein
MVARLDRGYGPRVLAAVYSLCAVLAGPPGHAPRGNTILDPSRDKRTFSAAAAGRFGILLGGGSEFVQPYGFGFAAQLYFHLLKMGAAPARFGFAFHGGHTRFLETQTFIRGDGDGEETIERTTVLSHTDFSIGPSFEVIAGPLVLMFGGGPGLGVDQLVRPLTADPALDQQAVDADFLLRGSAGIGIPIKNNHGLKIGAGVQKFFSGTRLPPDPLAENGEETQSVVFDLLLEVHVAYQAWF